MIHLTRKEIAHLMGATHMGKVDRLLLAAGVDQRRQPRSREGVCSVPEYPAGPIVVELMRRGVEQETKSLATLTRLLGAGLIGPGGPLPTRLEVVANCAQAVVMAEAVGDVDGVARGREDLADCAINWWLRGLVDEGGERDES